MNPQHSWHTGVLPKGRHMLAGAPGGSGSNSLTSASRRSGAPTADDESV